MDSTKQQSAGVPTSRLGLAELLGKHPEYYKVCNDNQEIHRAMGRGIFDKALHQPKQYHTENVNVNLSHILSLAPT
ncbi:hypothetical protein [Massilia sp. YIM B04103]|uniref:hypothetical protein n=1 Tax=Massilia sp. YIM B04103 TaxID=2963106 RepID=UPI00210C265A|nr:hypothetical protein [Massilia sp. YIM B04103]